MKAIAQATGRSVDKLKKQMEEVGDLGSIAENSKECSRFLLVSPPEIVSFLSRFWSRLILGVKILSEFGYNSKFIIRLNENAWQPSIQLFLNVIMNCLKKRNLQKKSL